MTAADRLGIAIRAFLLATIAGLALAFSEDRVLHGLPALAAVGACAVAAQQFTATPERWRYAVEGFVAALTAGMTLPQGDLLLPYLVVPTLIAGLSAGWVAVLLVTVTESAALVLVFLLGTGAAAWDVGSELAAPWLITGLVTGLTGSWVERARGYGSQGQDASYESARRLLSQLRVVARRLSSGLDAVSIATQALASVHEALDDRAGAVFVRTAGGVLVPLAYRGDVTRDDFRHHGELLDRCWSGMEPVMGSSPAAPELVRVALPLRSGSRMVGVIVADLFTAPSPSALSKLMQELDEQTVRLDTAMIFDEVRSLATIEERQRLAREIHDGIAQEVASLGYVVDELAAEASTPEQRDSLALLRREISRVVGELRLSIFDLRSEVSPDVGLGAALSDYVRAVGATSGLAVHLSLDEAPTRLRSEVEAELFRIAQEAVTNVRKHAAAHNLWVTCRVRPPFAALTVEDDGGGLRPPRADSFGLRIMKERAERVGGHLEVRQSERRAGALGTRVAVTVGQEPTSDNDAERSHGAIAPAVNAADVSAHRRRP